MLVPVAFESRRPRTGERVRKVHYATDVNRGGWTACGVAVADVEDAGVATISVPRREWTAPEFCGFCGAATPPALRRVRPGFESRVTGQAYSTGGSR